MVIFSISFSTSGTYFMASLLLIGSNTTPSKYALSRSEAPIEQKLHNEDLPTSVVWSIIYFLILIDAPNSMLHWCL